MTFTVDLFHKDYMAVSNQWEFVLLYEGYSSLFVCCGAEVLFNSSRQTASVTLVQAIVLSHGLAISCWQELVDPNQ